MIHNSQTFWSHFCLQVSIFKTIIRIFTAPLHFLTYSAFLSDKQRVKAANNRTIQYFH